MKTGQAYRLAKHAWNGTFECLYNVDEPTKTKKHPETGKLTTYLDYSFFSGKSGVEREFNTSEIFCVLNVICAYSVLAIGFKADRWLVKTVFEEGRIGWLILTERDLGNFEKV